MTDFVEHCRKGARRFVQTAIVIDNEAVLEPLGTSKTADEPRRATRQPGSVLLRDSPPVQVAGEPGDSSRIESPPAAADSGRASPAPEQASHKLYAKELTDAFFAQQIICGIYKPVPGEEMVALSTEAALHADLVIVDWYLERHSSQVAKELILSILKTDLPKNGRLRLIAVYTSQPGLSMMAREMLDAVEADIKLRECLALAGDGRSLSGTDTRICFFNKPNTIGSSDTDVVSERELPNRLVCEFACITEGVLATFAVDAVASVRRSAHHIVAVFRKELDGAYVGHRCALPNPDDAKEYAADLVASEIRNVIGMDEVAERCMDAQVLVTWVDHIAANGQVFTDHRGAKAEPDLVKKFIRGGASTVDNSHHEQRSTEGKPNVSKNKAITPGTVSDIFFQDADEAKRRNLEFARLATFKREAQGRNSSPGTWRPTLTLGSVLKVVRQNVEAYADLPTDYLICVQPRCDGVRLDGPTTFPFQTAKPESNKFNLVVRDGEGDGTELLVSYKPRDAVLVKFAPVPDHRTVRAEPVDENFVFVDVRQRRFVWLGDIKDLKAQRDASELAARMHSVGIDDFEWLRRKTSK